MASKIVSIEKESYLVCRDEYDDDYCNEKFDVNYSKFVFEDNNENGNNKKYNIYHPENMKDGMTYFLVYAKYSTGCTFGTTSGLTQEIALLESEEKAKELVNLLNEEKYTLVERNIYTVYKVTLSTGEVIEFISQWEDYFDSFDGADYVPIKAEKKK
jgi:hypothetical protein